MEKYPFSEPVLFSIVLGHEGEAPATPKALAAMIQMIPDKAVWGITQANRKDFSLLAAAVGLGARTVRIGFEDSPYLDENTKAQTLRGLQSRLCWKFPAALLKWRNLPALTPRR